MNDLHFSGIKLDYYKKKLKKLLKNFNKCDGENFHNFSPDFSSHIDIYYNITKYFGNITYAEFFYKLTLMKIPQTDIKKSIRLNL
jgi:hypothetical protein